MIILEIMTNYVTHEVSYGLCSMSSNYFPNTLEILICFPFSLLKSHHPFCHISLTSLKSLIYSSNCTSNLNALFQPPNLPDPIHTHTCPAAFTYNTFTHLTLRVHRQAHMHFHVYTQTHTQTHTQTWLAGLLRV